LARADCLTAGTAQVFAERANHGGALPAGRAHFPGGSDHCDAVFHDSQSHPGRRDRGGNISSPVVTDLELKRVFTFGEAEGDALGAPVFDGVAEGFLGDAVQMGAVPGSSNATGVAARNSRVAPICTGETLGAFHDRMRHCVQV
jgi:hypothetical protein